GVTLFPTVFCAFSFRGFTLKFFKCFAHLLLNFFFAWLFFWGIAASFSCRPAVIVFVEIISAASRRSSRFRSFFAYATSFAFFIFIIVRLGFLLLFRFFELGKINFLTRKVWTF